MIGQTVSHYRIIEKLGAGGMGVVYRAHDESLDRDVALKVLPAGALADEGSRARFRKEALALSQLNHPHICTIHEVGDAGGVAYIAMEYVEGRPLSELVPGDGLPVETLIRYGAQIAEALAHAHERGIAHRDLKSSNVMITPEGRAKVLDFGLARRLRESEVAEAARTKSTLTQAGSVVGTLHYMAPEVLRGEPGDARSDIWALGVLLYEAAAGELPFQGQTGFEVSSGILKESPAPLPARVPAGLRAIIQRCLAKEPGQRYQRAGELRAALEAIHSDAVGVSTVQPKPKRRYWLLAAAGALAVLLVAVVALRVTGKGRPLHVESVAVLPLENLSGDPQQDYFADGMTEELITDLAKIGAFRVISRPAVAKCKGARKPLPEIARELKVDAVVEGTVRRAGERVRITAQLIDPASERHLWAESYERDLRDILDLQREVARAIAAEIRVKLTPQEQSRLAGARPVHPEAYDAYLRGRAFFYRRTKPDNESAIAALERAVAIDPAFATGYAQLALACADKAFLFSPEQKQWEEKANVAVEKALSLDSNLGEAHFARARLLWTPSNRFPHENTIRECRLALDLNPNQDEARRILAGVYSHIGLPEKALQESERALALNPGSPHAQFTLGETFLFQGRYEQAIATLRSLPRDFLPSLTGAHTAWALFQLGRKQEATAWLADVLKNHPEDSPGLLASVQAILFAAAAETRKAEDKIKIASEQGKDLGPFHHAAYNIASAYALLGRPQPAVRWLETAADSGYPCYPVFERDPNLNNVRRDSAFVSLMGKLRGQWERFKTTFPP